MYSASFFFRFVKIIVLVHHWPFDLLLIKHKIKTNVARLSNIAIVDVSCFSIDFLWHQCILHHYHMCAFAYECIRIYVHIYTCVNVRFMFICYSFLNLSFQLAMIVSFVCSMSEYKCILRIHWHVVNAINKLYMFYDYYYMTEITGNFFVWHFQ